MPALIQYPIAKKFILKSMNNKWVYAVIQDWLGIL